MYSKLNKNICSHIIGVLSNIPTESLQINQKHMLKLYLNLLELQKTIKKLKGKLPMKTHKKSKILHEIPEISIYFETKKVNNHQYKVTSEQGFEPQILKFANKIY